MTVGELVEILRDVPETYTVYVQQGYDTPLKVTAAVNDGEYFKSVTICCLYEDDYEDEDA